MKTAIILAGGEGRRAGGDVPKQFQDLLGRPVVWWSLKAFHEADPQTQLVLVLHPGFLDDWDLMVKALPEDERFECRVCCGGRDRLQSVANGLHQVKATPGDLVAVHDGARPLVTAEMVRRGWETAAARGTAVPAVPVSDTLRRLESDGSSHTADRSLYVAVQTPQVFDAKILKEAYAAVGDNRAYTDDASVVQASGHSIALYQGIPENIKVTNPLDRVVAEAMMMALSKP